MAKRKTIDENNIPSFENVAGTTTAESIQILNRALANLTKATEKMPDVVAKGMFQAINKVETERRKRDAALSPGISVDQYQRQYKTTEMTRRLHYLEKHNKKAYDIVVKDIAANYKEYDVKGHLQNLQTFILNTQSEQARVSAMMGLPFGKKIRTAGQLAYQQNYEMGRLRRYSDPTIVGAMKGAYQQHVGARFAQFGASTAMVVGGGSGALLATVTKIAVGVTALVVVASAIMAGLAEIKRFFANMFGSLTRGQAAEDKFRMQLGLPTKQRVIGPPPALADHPLAKFLFPKTHNTNINVVPMTVPMPPYTAGSQHENITVVPMTVPMPPYTAGSSRSQYDNMGITSERKSIIVATPLKDGGSRRETFLSEMRSSKPIAFNEFTRRQQADSTNQFPNASQEFLNALGQQIVQSVSTGVVEGLKSGELKIKTQEGAYPSTPELQ